MTFVDPRNTFGFELQLTQQNIDYSLMQNGDLVIDTNNEATTATVYFEDEIVLDALTITPGVRVSHYSINDEILRDYSVVRDQCKNSNQSCFWGLSPIRP